MFLCLTGRLSAARTGKSATAFLAQTSNANRPTDAALTLHKNNNINDNNDNNDNNNYTFQRHRCFCVSGARLDPARLWRRALRDQDAPALVTPDRARWDRLPAVAPRLPEPAQSADDSDLLRQPTGRLFHNSAEESPGNVLFTGSWRVSSPRCAAWTTQTRASSTKGGDTGEGQTPADKGVI